MRQQTEYKKEGLSCVCPRGFVLPHRLPASSKYSLFFIRFFPSRDFCAFLFHVVSLHVILSFGFPVISPSFVSLVSPSLHHSLSLTLFLSIPQSLLKFLFVSQGPFLFARPFAPFASLPCPCIGNEAQRQGSKRTKAEGGAWKVKIDTRPRLSPLYRQAIYLTGWPTVSLVLCTRHYIRATAFPYRLFQRLLIGYIGLGTYHR